MFDAILEDLEGVHVSAGTATDARQIALLLEARILLFREKERIQILEARANQKPLAPPPPPEDVDLAVLGLQAQILAVELRERFPKQENEAAGITFFAPNTGSNPSERTLKLKKTDTADLVRVFENLVSKLAARRQLKSDRQSQ